MKKNLHIIAVLLIAFAWVHCGPKQAEKKTIDPNYIEDGGFEYTFGIPTEFSVAEADLGATISYAPNPTVTRYNLHMGLTEALEGIPQATALGFESPLDVDDANIIRITNGSLTESTEYFFAIEAFNSEGQSSGLTDIRSITVRDLVGIEVQYKAKLYACISGKNITRFSFTQGRMELAYAQDDVDGRLPGQGENKCEFEGVKLELQKVVNGEPTGNLYRFPSGTNSKKIFQHVGDYIPLDITGSHADFENMVTTEPMTIGFDGEIKKVCQGGITDKYRVKSRDADGSVEDNDPINSIEFDTSKCSKNNWTTFHPSRDNTVEFNLFFQTAE